MPAPMEPAATEISSRRVLKGGLTVAVGLGIAQASGFVRQAVIGYLLGTGQEADALTAAMAPVELWWTVLSISVIFGFVPRFTSAAPGGEWAFRDLLLPVAKLGAASSLVYFFLAGPLVRLFAPGLEADTVAMGAEMLRMMALAPAAVGCSFVYSALLMSRRRFAFASLHHAAVNLSTVLVAYLLYERMGSYGFAVGYALGAWLQLAAAYFYVAPLVVDQKRRLQAAGAGGKRADTGVVALLSGPAPIMAQALALECNTAVSRAFASTYGPGMTAAFDYGFKLFRVPLALLVVPLSQSLLPEISDMQSAADQRPVVRAMVRAAMLTFGVALVLMAGFMVFREPVVRLLFQRGEFGEDSTRAVTAVLLGYLPVMLGRGLVDLLSRTLFGMRKFRTPLVATTVALSLNVAICSLLRPENPVMIGLGASIGFLTAAIIVTAYVARLAKDG